MALGFYLFWARTFDFQGKSNRKEFWLGVLANSIIMVILLALLIVSLACFEKTISAFSIAMIILFSLFCLVELIPSISLIIRRMHDIGKSGYYIWVLFIPIAGLVWYFYLVTRPSDYFKN
ncbi:MAG: DUF805 domain-containing protein [Clostridia bacterium]|nr:DUF805 domain-containing protein [Clostridia bacterium]